MNTQGHITPQFFFYLRKYIHCLLSPHFYSLIFLAKFSYTFSTFNLLLKWHSFPFPQFLSSWYLFIFFLFCGKKMISTRNILFIFAIFCAQLYIFTQVQSVELRFALAVVSIFQIWKKTYYNNKPAADGRFMLSRNATKSLIDIWYRFSYLSKDFKNVHLNFIMAFWATNKIRRPIWPIWQNCVF